MRYPRIMRRWLILPLIDMIARFEPTIVAVLAVSVGLVLLSVMLPLVGVLSAIG